MRTLKLTLAYDGADYAGWQVQPGRRTIQGELETALRKITGEEIRTLAAGRTDAGVHARGQVVGVRTETHLDDATLQRALNAELPRDIAVLRVEPAADGFHPIRDARRKRYRYTIADGPVRDVFRLRYAWQHPVRLDDAAMAEAAKNLVGAHDMASFQTSGSPRKGTVRTIEELSVVRGRPPEEHLLTVEVQADGFLYNMVRAIVGTLVEVGRGAQPVEWLCAVRDARDRRVAGPNAPPQGLCLLWVNYD